MVKGETVSVGDSVVGEPYRNPNKTVFVGYFWFGKHKRTLKGVNLITLYYTDRVGHCCPINFRIYDKR